MWANPVETVMLHDLLKPISSETCQPRLTAKIRLGLKKYQFLVISVSFGCRAS